MEKKESFLHRHRKLIAYAVGLVLVVALIWYAFGDTLPEYFRLLQNGNEEEIEAYIATQSSWKGTVTIILLAALQVVSIVFPGFAIQIAAGVMYGWWKSFLMCYSGFIIGNMGVFFFARKMGGEIVDAATSGRNKKKKNGISTNWIRAKLKTTRPEFIVGFVNLLPILPNGIIPYLASGSSISALGYLLSIAATSWIQIIFNCLAGGFLKNGQYLFMVMAIGIQILLLVFVTVKRKWIMSLIPGGDEHEEDEPDQDI